MVENLQYYTKALVDFIKNKFLGIVQFFRGLGVNMIQAGENMMNMLKQGIENKINEIRDTASRVAQSIKDFLGFSSPTKEWPWSNSDKWMPNLIWMLVDGLDAWKDRIATASERIAEKIRGAIGEEAFESISGWIEPFLRNVETAFFAIDEKATASKDKIQTLKNEFLDLQKSLSGVDEEMAKVGQSLQETLASRAVDLQDQIEKISGSEDQSGLSKIKEELAYIKEQGITEQMINNILIERGKTESQKAVERAQAQIDELNMRKVQIQEEMDLKLSAMQTELDNYRTLTAEKSSIQSDFFALTWSYLKKQIADTDLAITRLRELRSLGWGVSLPAQSTSSSSSTQNMNINVNMWGMTVNNGDGNQVADQIITKITREMQLYKQGIA